jgi:hypothetical protein
MGGSIQDYIVNPLVDGEHIDQDLCTSIFTDVCGDLDEYLTANVDADHDDFLYYIPAEEQGADVDSDADNVATTRSRAAVDVKMEPANGMLDADRDRNEEAMSTVQHEPVNATTMPRNTISEHGNLMRTLLEVQHNTGVALGSLTKILLENNLGRPPLTEHAEEVTSHTQGYRNALS